MADVQDIKVFCPLCGKDSLQVSANWYMTDDEEEFDSVRITCKSCGLSGYGVNVDDAYDDMICRAPLQSIEETLSAYLGVISLTLDDMNNRRLSNNQIKSMIHKQVEKALKGRRIHHDESV